jgi:hypothetical protein
MRGLYVSIGTDNCLPSLSSSRHNSVVLLSVDTSTGNPKCCSWLTQYHIRLNLYPL